MKRLISAAAVILAAAAAVWGALYDNGARFDIASVIAAFLCCVPFFLSFEKRAPSAGELVLTALMTAFSAAGRFIFAPFPFFKPVTAVTAIAGMYLGAPAGFMTGALSAVISNIYFGQGPWTPFQMLGWGFIGFSAGALNRKKALEKPVFLCVFGAAAGVFFSLFMDLWTVMSAGGFSGGLWLSAVTAALPVTAVYCVSDIVFLLLLTKPVGKRIRRIKKKYGVFPDTRPPEP